MLASFIAVSRIENRAIAFEDAFKHIFLWEKSTVALPPTVCVRQICNQVISLSEIYLVRPAPPRFAFFGSGFFYSTFANTAYNCEAYSSIVCYLWLLASCCLTWG